MKIENLDDELGQEIKAALREMAYSTRASKDFKKRLMKMILDNHPEMKKKIAVIFGGCSPEYDISLQSAYGVIKNIDTDKYFPVLIGITRDGKWRLFQGDVEGIKSDTWNDDAFCSSVAVVPDRSESAIIRYSDSEIEMIHIDAAFPILHGKNGEDGTVQGVLEVGGIPIIGCGVLSSALCMDKERAHRLVSERGISVPKSFVIDRNTERKTIETYAETIGYPLFIKPIRAGSSFGVAKVSESKDLTEAINKAFDYDDKIIMEENIKGFEVGCAVMGGVAIKVGEVDEIELSDGFFDYTEKYSLKNSAIHVPARIDKSTAEQIKKTAKQIYRILDCNVFARVDMFLSDTGEIFFNEVNTIPGFTEHSRFPNMMKAAGYTFEQVVRMSIEQVLEK